MRRLFAPISLAFALTSIAACGETRKNTERALADLEPVKHRLEVLYDALPESPVEAECDPKLEGKKLWMVNERHLGAVLGKLPEIEEKKERILVRNWNTGQMNSLPTASRVTKMLEEPDVSYPLNIERIIKRLTDDGYIVIARTDDYSLGKLEGNTILEAGHWKGWYFVGEVATGKIVGTIKMDVKTDDTAHSFDAKGKAPSLRDNLWLNIRDATPKAGKEACGIVLGI